MALYTVSPGDIAMLTMVGRLDAQVIMNTFHYKAGTITWVPDGPNEVLKLCQKVGDLIWTPFWKPRVTNNYSLLYIQGQIIYPTRRVYLRQAYNEAGTLVSTALPSFNTASITRYGSIAGRGRSASLQISGITSAQVLGSELNDAAMADFQEIADMLPVNQQDSEGTPDAWLPVNWTVAKAGENNPIRGATVHREVRTEKRRVVGQGI